MQTIAVRRGLEGARPTVAHEFATFLKVTFETRNRLKLHHNHQRESRLLASR